MKVIKFGGTSMGNAEMIEKSAQISLDIFKQEPVVVVVSAMTKVTDTLIDICNQANEGKFKNIQKIINGLKDKHYQTLEKIVGKQSVDSIWKSSFASHFEKLEIMSKGMCLLKDVSDRNRASVLYFGELLSSLLIVETIKKLGNNSIQLLSKNLIRTTGDYMDADVDRVKTKGLCNNVFKNIDMKKTIPVITGFVGGNENKDVNLLGRGGSDYVATIIGEALKVQNIEIRTDVDGIFSADPRVIKDSIVRSELDYTITAELALAGAKVLHPKTLLPAIRSKIPVWVKNTFNPTHTGTKIYNVTGSSGIKGLNLNNNQILLLFTDNNMFGEIGTINRITDVFLHEKTPIDDVATSEVSITCSVSSKLMNKKLLQKLESVCEVKLIDNVSKISLVGHNIGNDGNVMSQTFAILKDYNIHFVSHSASGNNITLFVDKNKGEEVLKKLHKKLFCH